MKLQIALDTFQTSTAISLVRGLENTVDIVEIGTPMIINYGLDPIRAMKGNFPRLTVLADTKIMDAGELESAAPLRAGAGIVTVMGITHDETVRGAVTAAKKYGGKVMADMMCVENLEDRARQLIAMGVEYICVHSAVDVQKTEKPFDALRRISSVVGAEHCVIAGGVNLQNVAELLPYRPGIVIVGNGITGAPDPAVAAKTMQSKLKEG